MSSPANKSLWSSQEEHHQHHHPNHHPNQHENQLLPQSSIISVLASSSDRRRCDDDDNDDDNDDNLLLLEQIKAEARAFALSSSNGTTKSSSVTKKKKKSKKRTKQQRNITSSSSFHPRRSSSSLLGKGMGIGEDSNEEDEEDDEYQRMIQSLTTMDYDMDLLQNLWKDEDEDLEFHLSDLEETDELFSISKNNRERGEQQKDMTRDGTSSITSSTVPLNGNAKEVDDEEEEDDENLNWLLTDDFYKDLEDELGELIEEDMEATLQSLWIHNNSSSNHSTVNNSTTTYKQQQQSEGADKAFLLGVEAADAAAAAKGEEILTTRGLQHSATSTTTDKQDVDTPSPRRLQQTATSATLLSPSTATASTRFIAPNTQYQQQRIKLQQLLQQHYQLLIQQSILSVRAAAASASAAQKTSGPLTTSMTPPATSTTTANTTKKTQVKPNSNTHLPNNSLSFFASGETDMDLAEVLDLAVSMLQDLDHKRQDALREQWQHLHGTLQQQQENDKSLNSVGDGDSDDDYGGGDGPRRTLFADKKDDNVGSQNQLPVNVNTYVKNATTTNPTTTTTPYTRRLTRAAFAKYHQEILLQQHQSNPTMFPRSMFDIRGLAQLKDTFDTIDKSVDIIATSEQQLEEKKTTMAKDAVTINKAKTNNSSSTNNGTTLLATSLTFNDDKSNFNILKAPTHNQACHLVLQQAGAPIHESFLPETVDITENFASIQEALHGIRDEDSRTGPVTDVDPASSYPSSPNTTPLILSESQQLYLRQNRNLFTASEDNLVLRGVNLYGEKQWLLIADRYLPDRSVPIISQRYSKLCVLIYQAHGVQIDGEGNLPTPPKLESVDDIDEDRITALGLTKVEPPAILNVHRWSMQEDLTLLKAVPIMGNMWAELAARLIPHRDRGHLRKRYQVLERRIKATIQRENKFIGYSYSHRSKISSSADSQEGIETDTSAVPRPRGSPGRPFKKGKAVSTVQTDTNPHQPTATIEKGTATAINPNGPTPNSTATTSSLPKDDAKTSTVAVKPMQQRQGSKPVSSKISTDADVSEQPPMSLERAAATLATVQRNEGQKQAAAATSKAASINCKTAAVSQAAKSFSNRQDPHQWSLRTSNGRHYPPPPPQHPSPYYPATAWAQPYSHPYPPSVGGPYSHGYPYPPHYYGYVPPPPIPPQYSQPPSTNQQSETSKKKTHTDEKSGFTKTAKQTATSDGTSTAKATTAMKDKKSRFALFQSIHEDSSRLAVEQLIQDTAGDHHVDGDEWSRIRHIMDTEDDESQAALLSHLRSPNRASKMDFSSSQFSAGFDVSNVSGLSVLNEGSRQPPPLTAVAGTDTDSSKTLSNSSEGFSIMARVLASCKNKGESRQDRNQSEAAASPRLETPTKSRRSSGLMFARVGNDNTAGVASPPFQSSQSPNTLLRNGEGIHTNLSIPYSPTDSTVMVGRIFDEDSKSTSPSAAASHEVAFVRELSWSSQPSLSQFQQSQQQLQGGGNNPTANNSNNSLLGNIAADDFEAISALEALSNSPFRAAASTKLSQLSFTQSDNTDDAPAARQSLFSKVIGGTKNKSQKRKAAVNKASKKIDAKTGFAAPAQNGVDLSAKKRLKFGDE